MATFKQVVIPDLSTRVHIGWCLYLVRVAFGVPEFAERAYYAAQKTKRRYAGRQMPNVMVPVWFLHWGTYGGVTGEFGHVVIWVPGRGFLSSANYIKWQNGVEVPTQQWFSSIDAIERAFNAKYLFWSEDIGGVNVVTKVSNSITPSGFDPFRFDEEDDMRPTIHYRTDGGGEWTRALPEIGKGLKPGEKRVDGKVTVYRGFEVTADTKIGTAWARSDARGVGGEHSRTKRSDYIEIQAQATRLSVELYG